MSKMCPRIAAALLLAVCAATVRGQVSIEGAPNKDQKARPGDRYAGVVTVKNTTSEAQELRLYQRDFSSSADGKNTFAEPASTPRSNAGWISLGRSRVVIPARTSIELPFTVSVPAAPLAGSYWSMVMIEPIPKGSQLSSVGGTKNSQPRIGVVTRLRHAVTIVTNVDSGVHRDARFEAPTVQVSKKDSSQALQLDLRNSGNYAYPPTFRLELYRANGTNVTTVSTTREYLYPGSSMRETFPLGKLPHGKYKAILTVDAGGGSVFGAQYSFTF